MAGLRRSSRASRHGAKADLADAGPAPGALDPGPPHPGPPLLDLPFRVVEPAPAAGVSVVEVDLDRAAHRGRSHLPAHVPAHLPAHLPVQPPFAAPPAPAGPEDSAASGTEGRRRWPRRRKTSTPAANPGVLDLPAPRGYVARRSPRKARRGWYAPQALPALTSTRQAQVLNTALVAAPTDAYGIFVGRDRLSNTPVAHDVFTAYERGVITSPAVVVIGVVGAGKSSLLKTVYVLRPLILRGRRVVVMDRKDRGGEGEYCDTSRQLGAEPLRMVLGGGGTTLNILDPVVLAGAGVAGQARLLIALAELANDGAGLDKWEKAALRAAHRATLAGAEADGVVPLLEHLLAQLGRSHPEYAGYSAAAKERIHQAGLGVHHLLSALLGDELSGLFDGPTSPDVRLAERLTVFDVSQLPDDGPAVAMVMAVANVWLLGTLRHQRGLRTNFIAEEGWDLVGGPGGRVFQRNSKLARGLGLSNIAALHHVADIPPDDPAVAMLKEAQTVHLYRQDRDDDVEAVIRLYGLDPGSRNTLANLADGHHLLKIGNRREIHVEHVRSRLERGLTDTDEAMVAGGRDSGRDRVGR